MAQIFLILGFIFCVGAIGGLFDPEKILEKVVKDPKKRTRGVAFTLYSVMAFVSFIIADAISDANKTRLVDKVPSTVQAAATLEQPAKPMQQEPPEVTTDVGSPKTNWSYYFPSFEHGLKKTICTASRCGGFSFTQVGAGKVKDNEAAIFKVEYVEVKPGKSEKTKKCSYLMAAYDKDFKDIEYLQASWSYDDNNCSMKHPIYAGNGTTFQQMLQKNNYIGSGPTK